ncbi:MAG TPA: carboxypeptidase-like regulatory domain-containing protein [Saprospiraceae bacterium]|nr:carboxypeptidase-like regulatory domain-containing protein [Saprospiraceae bacterium]
MKKKTLKLTIPSPCETSSTEMFRALDGKFCYGCKRVVIDFTKMNDPQLLEYFTQHHGKICGEFRPEQINKDIKINTPSAIDIFRHRTAAVAAITSLAIGIPATQINAQSTHYVTEQQVRGKIRMDSIPKESQPNAVETEKIIRGSVVAETGEAVIYANVMIVGTAERILKGTTTDLDGNFQLSVPLSILEQQGLSVLVTYTGYPDVRIELNKQTASEPINVVLKGGFLLGTVAGGIRIVEYEENSVETDSIRKIQKTVVEIIDAISIFPNPFSQSFKVNAVLARRDLYELFLFNEDGKVFWSEIRKLRKGSNEFEIKITEPLAAGNYIFHIRSMEMQLSEILVKAE